MNIASGQILGTQGIHLSLNEPPYPLFHFYYPQPELGSVAETVQFIPWHWRVSSSDNKLAQFCDLFFTQYNHAVPSCVGE
jgi:hypothetical protein